VFRQDRVDLLFVRVVAVASGEVDEARGHVNIAGPRTSRPSSDSSSHYSAYIVLAPECFAKQDPGEHFSFIAIKTVKRGSLRFNPSYHY